MSLFNRRSTLVWALWFTALAAASLAVRGSIVGANRIPQLVPMVVSLPADASPEARQKIETEFESLGVGWEFVPKDLGLAKLHSTLMSARLPVDTELFDDIPANPLPDVYIVRASCPPTYSVVADSVSAAIPGAQVQHDGQALSRIMPVLQSVRGWFIAAFAMLCVLFCLSAADRMRTEELEGAVECFGSSSAGLSGRIRVQVRNALAGFLCAIVAVGSVLTVVGYAVGRRPSLAIRPYVDVFVRAVRETGVGWIFGLSVLAGWLVLVLMACIIAGKPVSLPPVSPADDEDATR